MRLIIAGSRHLTVGAREVAWLIENIAAGQLEQDITEIVSGRSGKVDLAGEVYARLCGLPVELFPYPSEYGRRGGPIRNRRMGAYADGALILWDGKSRGAADMARVILGLEKPLWLFTYPS